jgi:hypothetical protein
MHSSQNRVTTMDQLYATASSMQAPVLIHIDGEIEWGNQSFGNRFGVKPEAAQRVKIRELLWCLGLAEPICGMIAESIPFRHCELPALNPGDSTTVLKHQALPMLSDGRKRMLLVLADEFDPEPADICIGGN